MSSGPETPVREIMSTPVETISPETRVTEAAAKMRDEELSALLVTTAPPSIVTTTDMLDVLASGASADATVADVMTESVETVPPELEVRRAAEMMMTYGISHLPVVDDDYRGIVSSTDITRLQS